MPLAPLATDGDLLARGDVDGELDLALAVASAAIRDAAGGPISAVASTVTVSAPSGPLLTLPGPVTGVTEVLVDGAAVTDYRVVGNGLWRRGGWGCEPVPVTVTATFGLPEVPEDIVDLCCTLAQAWLSHQAGGGGSTAGVTSVAIDDARETYSDESAAAVSPVFIPKVTREWLAARFGGGPAVVETM